MVLLPGLLLFRSYLIIPHLWRFLLHYYFFLPRICNGKICQWTLCCKPSLKCMSLNQPIFMQLLVFSSKSAPFRRLGNTMISSAPKCKDLAGPNNRRPISLIAAISKVFEAVISDRMPSFLKHEGRMRDQQYGLRLHRSSGDQSALGSHSWGTSHKNHGETHLVLLHIHKAFDQVWHGGLLAKVHAIGFSPVLISCTSSILNERIMSIRVERVLSQSFPVSVAISQDSALALTLSFVCRSSINRDRWLQHICILQS